MIDGYKKLTNTNVNKVNDTVRSQNKTLEIFAPKEFRKEFLDLVKFGYERELLLSKISEVSVRTRGDFFLTHKANRIFRNLILSDLEIHSINISRTEENLDGLRHMDWHRSIYHNLNANAVVISHPKNIFTYLSTSDQETFDNLIETFEFLPKFKIKLADEIPEVFFMNQFTFVPGHGLVAWGDQLGRLLADLEYLNWICSINYR